MQTWYKLACTHAGMHQSIKVVLARYMHSNVPVNGSFGTEVPDSQLCQRKGHQSQGGRT